MAIPFKNMPIFTTHHHTIENIVMHANRLLTIKLTRYLPASTLCGLQSTDSDTLIPSIRKSVFISQFIQTLLTLSLQISFNCANRREFFFLVPECLGVKEVAGWIYFKWAESKMLSLSDWKVHALGQQQILLKHYKYKNIKGDLL